ncbi:MAG: putative bifunctional diguanylate cyclase/phosphodiesterase [Xanthobacteraceae bacterium]
MRPPHETLPFDIYLSTVDALYSDARSLLAGSIGAPIAALITYWKSGDGTLLACAVALILIGTARAFDMRNYARQPRPGTLAQARRWETRYIVGSAAYVAVLGLWCFLAFAHTTDPVVQLISLSAVLAYLIGIAGRNFSNDRLVVIQTVCAAVPMIAGLLVQNDIYYTFLALLFVPFYLSIRFISARLRGILFDAVMATHDVRLLAERFDTALNNMPHGLCMFDAQRRFVVSNSHFTTLLGLPVGPDRAGQPVATLLDECLRAGRLPAAMAADIAERFTAALAVTRRETFALETVDGRALELTFEPMAQGGCVVLVEDATERRSAEAKIEHMARFDALTGLPNRTSFTQQFERLLQGVQATGRAARGVLFVDLDDFKKVNDTLGHSCGDALLAEAAQRLRRVVREGDLVARFGGDEFVVLQAMWGGRDEAANLADRIIEAIGTVFEIDGHQIVIGASVGIAVAPQDGTDVEQLLKSADMALYRAKADGRGVWRFFERGMDVKAQARRALELDMRDALARNEFQLHYQPILDLRTGRTVVCEALLRWSHPQRGMVSPAEFIPVAEEMGLIVDLGRWVLRQACIECTQWPDDVGVAVNLSPIQFRRTNVEALVRDALTVSSLAASRLELEITETVLLQDTPTTRTALRQLRNMGVRVALDDFGTGYSSLSYLQAFPLNKIKIDRSFVIGIDADPRAMKLFQGVARLSAGLGMTVVVEGVETQQQLAMVHTEKTVTEGQGYLFSRPVNSTAIRAFLETERAAARVA